MSLEPGERPAAGAVKIRVLPVECDRAIVGREGLVVLLLLVRRVPVLVRFQRLRRTGGLSRCLQQDREKANDGHGALQACAVGSYLTRPCPAQPPISHPPTGAQVAMFMRASKGRPRWVQDWVEVATVGSAS